MRKYELKFLIWWKRRFNKKATYAFYYSKEQHKRILQTFAHFYTPEIRISENYVPLDHLQLAQFKGVDYTEMVPFGGLTRLSGQKMPAGVSNFPDAKLIGIGTYADITRTNNFPSEFSL